MTYIKFIRERSAQVKNKTGHVYSLLTGDSAFVQFATDNIETEFKDEVNIMSWEYERAVLTVAVKTDSIEELFNLPGKDHW